MRGTLRAETYSVRMARRRSLAIVTLAAAIAVSAAGASASASIRQKRMAPASLRLDFTVNGKHAPFYLGLKKGYYREQGIDLTINEGRGSLSSVQLVTAGQDTFAFADQSAVVQTVAAGGAVKTVAAFQEQQPIAAISLAPLRRPQDLYNKKIGLNPVGAAVAWAVFVARNHLDSSKLNVVSLAGPALAPALAHGDLDVIIGLSNSDAAAVPALTDKPVYVLPFSKWGVQALAHGLVAQTDTIEHNPKLVLRFVRASVLAWKYSMQHPQEAIDALLSYFPSADPATIRRQWDRSVPLIYSAANKQHRLGWMSPQDWGATLALYKYGGVQTTLPPTAFYTNAFVNKVSPPIKKTR